MEKLVSTNPSRNYEVIGEVDITTENEIREKVISAHHAFKEWSIVGIDERITLLKKIFDELNLYKNEIALLESKEMGMPITESLLDFDLTLDFTNWYFDNAHTYLSPETTFENDVEIHQVFYEPLGVSAVIVPWNFPFANIVWSSIQSLLAGNTIVFKHSEECPLTAKYIQDIMSRHMPQGVFDQIYGAGAAGRQLVDQQVDMIEFIGSTKTGRSLYETAGKKFIRAVMELGGSAPAIIFDDADIDIATTNVCFLRLLNAGQCCDGLKRLIVHQSKVSDVTQRLEALFSKKKVGPADEMETEIGPLVAKRQLELLISQVEDAVEKGAYILTGGNSLDKKLGGAFFEPTILTNINPEMRVWKEEVFGPVLPVMTFDSEEEAVALANKTDYGLGSYVFTQDKQKAQRVARSLEAGMVGINGIDYIKPFNPFGGYKQSGIGREHGKFGFHEVTQAKIVASFK